MSGSGETEALLQVVSKYSKQISEDFGFRKFLSQPGALDGIEEVKFPLPFCEVLRVK